MCIITDTNDAQHNMTVVLLETHIDRNLILATPIFDTISLTTKVYSMSPGSQRLCQTTFLLIISALTVWKSHKRKSVV